MEHLRADFTEEQLAEIDCGAKLFMLLCDVKAFTHNELLTRLVSLWHSHFARH